MECGTIEFVEEDYKRFLYALAHKSTEDILSPPTQDVDEFWHQHILDTRKYREDCNTIFGHYLDHTPGLSPEEQGHADERRRQIYQKYRIDSMSLDAKDTRRASDDGGFSSDFTDAGDGHTHATHSTHGSHDAGSSHGCDAGHGADASGSDGGGGDGGGGDGGGGDGGGGCGGGGGGCGG